MALKRNWSGLVRFVIFDFKDTPKAFDQDTIEMFINA